MQDGQIILIGDGRQYLLLRIGGIGQHGKSLIAVRCYYNLIESLHFTMPRLHLHLIRVSLNGHHRATESHFVFIRPGKRFYVGP